MGSVDSARRSGRTQAITTIDSSNALADSITVGSVAETPNNSPSMTRAEMKTSGTPNAMPKARSHGEQAQKIAAGASPT